MPCPGTLQRRRGAFQLHADVSSAAWRKRADAQEIPSWVEASWARSFTVWPINHAGARFDLIKTLAIEFPDGESVLPPGRLQATIDEVRAALVDGFPNSVRRRPLFERWVALREAIRRIVEVDSDWLDGSYVTKKEEPNDIDMLTIVDEPAIEALDEASKTLLKGLVARELSRELHECHSFLLVSYPEGHPAHGVYQATRQYWENLFGHDRGGDPKGFLEIVE